MKILNLALSFILELCLLVAFAYWGFQFEGAAGWIIGIGAPVIAAVIWGMWLAPRSQKRLVNPSLTIAKLLLFGLGALALWNAGQATLALLFAFLVIVNLGLVQLWQQDAQTVEA